jgi:hypothetical protein
MWYNCSPSQAAASPFQLPSLRHLEWLPDGGHAPQYTAERQHVPRTAQPGDPNIVRPLLPPGSRNESRLRCNLMLRVMKWDRRTSYWTGPRAAGRGGSPACRAMPRVLLASRHPFSHSHRRWMPSTLSVMTVGAIAARAVPRHSIGGAMVSAIGWFAPGLMTLSEPTIPSGSIALRFQSSGHSSFAWKSMQQQPTLIPGDFGNGMPLPRVQTRCETAPEWCERSLSGPSMRSMRLAKLLESAGHSCVTGAVVRAEIPHEYCGMAQGDILFRRARTQHWRKTRCMRNAEFVRSVH